MHAVCVTILCIMKRAQMNVFCVQQDITQQMKSTVLSVHLMKWKDAQHALQETGHAIHAKLAMHMTRQTSNVLPVKMDITAQMEPNACQTKWLTIASNTVQTKMHAVCVAIRSSMKKAQMNVCCALQDITLLME